MNSLLSVLLEKRGISEPSLVQAFLTPNYDNHTHDPLLLKDARKAAERIISAIEAGETIAVFSDYDADGIPGAVVMADFFEKVKASYSKGDRFKVIHYIPDRHEEGFGLSIDAVNELKNKGVHLLITVDCGSTDVLPVQHAQQCGIDVIITDHHIPPPAVPSAYAIVNPKQIDCQYPEKMLCGSGVAYKLIQAILAVASDRLGIKEGQEKWLLDMVGIATLSDMVPLVGENRIFALYGLHVLKKSPRIGLLRLLKQTKINQKYLNEDDIGFMITPRINAASRMGSAYDAFRLLSTRDETEADLLVRRLEDLNNERKGIVSAIVKEAKKIVETMYEKNIPPLLVIGSPSWRPSLLGLVANTLVETYDRPVFLWGREGGSLIKGSCRSNGTISVVDIMNNVPKGVFIDAGGHHMAGGFSVAYDYVHTLDSILEKAFLTATQHTSLIGVSYDTDMLLDDIGESTWRIIEQCAPFGFGNPKPIFRFSSVEVSSVKQFGSAKNHLEITFQKSSGAQVKAIAFFSSSEHFDTSIEVGKRVDCLAHIEKSFFMNRPEIRLRIVDILPARG